MLAGVQRWDELADAGNFEEALALVDALPADERLLEWSTELRCLWNLGHGEELVARCCELEQTGATLAAAVLPWKCLGLADALVRAGDAELERIVERVAPAILGVDVEASLAAAPVRWVASAAGPRDDLFESARRVVPGIVPSAMKAAGAGAVAAVRSGDACFVTLGLGGLLVADVAAPHAPHLQARLVVEHQVDQSESAAELILLDDVLFVGSSGGTWMIDVADSRHPRSIAILPGELRPLAAARIAKSVLLLDDAARVWTIDLSDRSSPRVLHAAAIVEEDAPALLRPRAAAFAEGKLFVLGERGVFALARAPLSPRRDVAG